VFLLAYPLLGEFVGEVHILDSVLKAYKVTCWHNDITVNWYRRNLELMAHDYWSRDAVMLTGADTNLHHTRPYRPIITLIYNAHKCVAFKLPLRLFDLIDYVELIIVLCDA
jgi:hypothetical protein